MTEKEERQKTNEAMAKWRKEHLESIAKRIRDNA
jgi:hypothetical protein